MKSNRRNFLKYSSALMGSASTGLLGAGLRPLEAHANNGRPIRLVTFMNGLGVPHQIRNEHWVKNASNEITTLRDSDFRLGLEPLKKYRENMLVLNGLDNKAAQRANQGGHPGAAGHLFTGGNIKKFNKDQRSLITTTGPSLDVHIGNAIANSGFATPHKHLNINAGGTLGGSDGMNWCYDLNGIQVPRMRDPNAIFNRLFSNQQSAPAPEQSVAADDLPLEAKLRVLNLAGSQAEALKKSLPSMSGHDALSFYKTSVDQLVNELSSQQASSCSGVQKPSDNSVEKKIRGSMDLAFQSLNCNLSRVMSLDFGGAQPTIKYTFLKQMLAQNGATEGHSTTQSHAVSHGTKDKDHLFFAITRAWYAQVYREFIDKLANTVDIDGTSMMLDNTIIYWTTEISRGYDHSLKDYPIVVIAGKNTGFKQGGLNCYFDGRPLNDLYTAILQGFGLPYDSFGERSVNNGPLDIMV